MPEVSERVNKQWVIPLLLMIICLGVGYHFRYEAAMFFLSFQRAYQEEESQDEWSDFACWQARNPAHFAEHDKIIIFTPQEKYIYQIVAAYEYPADHILSNFDFTTEAETKAYLERIPGFVRNTNGNLRTKTELKAPLLTLSTCTPDDAGMRCLVQAVLMTREVP